YLVLDASHGKILFMSWQLLASLGIQKGRSEAEMIGRSFLTVMVNGQQTRRDAYQRLQAALKEGRPCSESVVCSDRLAPGLLAAAAASGLTPEAGAAQQGTHRSGIRGSLRTRGRFGQQSASTTALHIRVHLTPVKDAAKNVGGFVVVVEPAAVLNRRAGWSAADLSQAGDIPGGRARSVPTSGRTRPVSPATASSSAAFVASLGEAPAPGRET
ncbi:hypothetical protein HK405_012892, partial [Cladochytrium tenue]